MYCAVSVAGADYPCSLSTFSAPGNGRAVIAPISAALHLVENPELPGKISLGCGLNDGSAAAGAGGIDAHGSPATGAGSVTTAKLAQPKGWWRWLHRVRKLLEVITGRRPRRASAPAVGRDGSASGSIFVVSRGECTFEEKVWSARC